jgi:hypothetical protein
MDSTADFLFVAVMMRVFSLLRIPPSGVASSSNHCRKYLTSSGWRTSFTLAVLPLTGMDLK